MTKQEKIAYKEGYTQAVEELEDWVIVHCQAPTNMCDLTPYLRSKLTELKSTLEEKK